MDRGQDRLDRQQGNDSQDAALAALAQPVFGEVLLWITAFGLAGLALWQVFETIWRRTPDEGSMAKVFGRVGSTFGAIAYLALCVSAARVALAGHAARDGRRTADTTSATEEMILRVLIVVIGVVFLVLAVRSIYRGIPRSFVGDLKDSVNTKVVILGQAGFIGNGITLGIVGALMIITAIDARPVRPASTRCSACSISRPRAVLLVLKAVGICTVRDLLLRLGRQPPALAGSMLPRQATASGWSCGAGRPRGGLAPS